MPEFSVPPAATLAGPATLTDSVWDNARRAPDRVQFVRRGSSADVTCRQFRDEVIALARGLVAAGVEPGVRVGLLSRTRYEWTLVDYAIWAVGGVTVPMYETSSADQVTWMMSDSGALVCVVETGDHAAMLAEAAPDLREVWQIDAGDLDRLVERGEAVDPAEIEARRDRLNSDDLATIIYTSGTTGRPKGCMLTHRNVGADVANAVAALPELFYEGASTLLFLPLAHSFARLIQVGAVQTRSMMAHSAEMEHLTDELRQFRPTFLLIVPRVFEKVHDAAARQARAKHQGWIFQRAERAAVAYSEALESRSGPGPLLRLRHLVFDRLVYRKLRDALGGRCRYAISGGAPLNTRLGHFFRGAGLTVLEGYGMTETSPAATVNRPGATRIGTVGQPMPSVTVQIAENGEVLLKGELVFQGYWRNPQLTAEAMTDGWLRSGDVGELDGDGFLRITGRIKDIIVTAAGKHVAPSPLEERIQAHQLVSYCMLVGDRRPFVAALVTIDRDTWPRWLAEHGCPPKTSVAQMRENPTLCADIQSAIDEANKTVSRPEAIKKFRILPEDFSQAKGELTPTLKVRREVARRTCESEITAIYGG